MGIFNFFQKRDPSMELYNLQNALRIANDCADLIENTINPKVFFDRYDLYLEKLALLSEAQKCKAIKVKGENLIQKYSQMSTLEKRVSATNEFIDRFWRDTCAKANTLKTEKGKNNRYQNFLILYPNIMKECPKNVLNTMPIFLITPPEIVFQIAKLYQPIKLMPCNELKPVSITAINFIKCFTRVIRKCRSFHRIVN